MTRRCVMVGLVVASVACSESGNQGDPVDPYADDGGGAEGGEGAEGEASCAEPAAAYSPQGEGECEGKPGTIRGTLPGTGSEYCVVAHPDCSAPGGGCGLVVTANTAGVYFSKVAEPEQWGPLVVVETYGPSDGNEVKDTLAELPRVLMQRYPGIDPARISIVGWSAGAGTVSRGLCHVGKGADESSYGTTSDLYSAIAVLGGCPSCSDDFTPLPGNWHVFATNGIEDQFGGEGCEDRLRMLAQTNGCERADEASWRNVQADDPYVANGDGTNVAQLISFGECSEGDVLGYRFADEGHVVSYKEHFDPKVSAYAMAWAFLQGRRKDGGATGPAPQCP